MHSKLTKFLCLQLQFIPDLSRFLSTNHQQTELLKKSNATSISGSFWDVVCMQYFPSPLSADIHCEWPLRDEHVY